MVTLECRDCGIEEHFESIEDAILKGWEYDYEWVCPTCMTEPNTGDDSLL